MSEADPMRLIRLSLRLRSRKNLRSWRNSNTASAECPADLREAADPPPLPSLRRKISPARAVVVPHAKGLIGSRRPAATAHRRPRRLLRFGTVPFQAQTSRTEAI